MRLWIQAIWRWLWEGRLAWLTLGVVIIAIAAIDVFGFTEPSIRIAGLILQLLGIGTVAWGIRETRMLFGRPDIIKLAVAWLRRFPVYGGRNISGSFNFQLPPLQMHMRGHSSVNAGPDASIEQRIDALETNLQYVQERITQTQNEADEKFRIQSDALTTEKQLRESAIRDINAKLEATETGGLHISAMGVVWLFFGVALSTVAPELALWFK